MEEERKEKRKWRERKKKQTFMHIYFEGKKKTEFIVTHAYMNKTRYFLAYRKSFYVHIRTYIISTKQRVIIMN